MYKIVQSLVLGLVLLSSHLAMASEFYEIRKHEDTYSFLECTSSESQGEPLKLCQPIRDLNTEEMGFFYEHLEAEVDSALYKKKWIKRGLFVGGIIGGALLLMTPPGQAVAAAIATGVAAPSGLVGSWAFGGIVLEAAVGLTAVPLISGGVAYYAGGELVEYQLQTMDADSGKALVEGLFNILDKSDYAVLEKSSLVIEALQNTEKVYTEDGGGILN